MEEVGQRRHHHHDRGRSRRRLSLGRMYQLASVVGAVLAILLAPLPEPTSLDNTSSRNSNSPQQQQQHPLSFLPLFKTEEGSSVSSSSPEKAHHKDREQHLEQQPPWFRWLMKLNPLNDDANDTCGASGRDDSCASQQQDYFAWLDSNIWNANSTAVADKILNSSPRLLLLANFWFVCTMALPAWIAQLCLGTSTTTTTAAASTTSPAVVFKFLVLFSVVDRQWFDWFLLVLWGATLQFLRALVDHCRTAVDALASRSHAPSQQHRSSRAVPAVLTAVLLCDILAAACCVGLLHAAGFRVVLVLTWECLLVGLDVMQYLLQYWAAVTTTTSSSSETDDASTHVLEYGVVGLEFGSDVLTVVHYIHIWSLHGLQLTLVDGVLLLELHSALCKTYATLLRFWKEQQLSRDLNVAFVTATDTDLHKAVDDVCCICLREFNDTGATKRLDCGHLYHSACLRQVIHRARSLHAARCPLCRSPLIGAAAGAAPEAAATAPQPAAPPVPAEQPLFRFSTQHWFPNWLPALSLEVVRQDAAVEELAAIDALSNMFPGMERADLTVVLHRTGTVDTAVDTILAANRQQQQGQEQLD